jgi:hypothetical protein
MSSTVGRRVFIGWHQEERRERALAGLGPVAAKEVFGLKMMALGEQRRERLVGEGS